MSGENKYFLSGAVNNPRESWLEYLGLPDIDDWTLEDLRGSVTSFVTPASAPAPAASDHEITMADFQDYLRRVGEPYRFLSTNRLTACSNESAAPADEVPTDEDLSMIPAACFKEHFDLTTAETFNIFSPPDQPHTTMVTLERLTHYLDQIELKLLNEVSTKSEGFFEALNSYEVLTREVAIGCVQIESLRERMRTLETNLALKSLRLPRAARRRVHTALLLNKLRLVHAVWRTQPTIQQLLTSRDFPSALELITSSQQLLNTELAGVAALGPLKASLEHTRKLIKDMMSKDLLRLALGYDPDNPPSLPVEALASEMDAKLVPLATGLLRLGVLYDAVVALEEQLKKDLRLLIKRRLQTELANRAEATDAVSDEKPAADVEPGAGHSAEIADGRGSRTVNTQLRELSVDGFEDVIGRVAAPILTLLRRAAVIDAALRKALARARAAHSSTSSEDGSANDTLAAYSERVEKESSGMVQRVCELAHDRYARLLKTRKDVHARLPLASFVRMRKSVNEFVSDAQHLSGQPYDALSGELRSHAQAFLQATHETSMQKLEAIIEIEQWKQVDVPPEFQDIVNLFARNEVPQICEDELLRLRDAAVLDTAAAAKELIVDGSGFKVSAPEAWHACKLTCPPISVNR